MYITKKEKSILIFTAAYIAVFIMAWLLLYAPLNRAVRARKAELLRVKGEISALETAIAKGGSLEEGLSLLQARLEALSGKFPEKEEETIRLIANIANKSGLEILSIRPHQKILFLDKEKKPVRIGNSFCHELTVSITARSTYMKLGRFLETLEEDCRQLLTLKKINMAKSEKENRLDIDMELTMYLLIKGK